MMRFFRCFALLLTVSLCFAAGCGRKKLPPPDETVKRWWSAVAAGDRAAADAQTVGDARESAAAKLAEYARVKTFAAAGDEMAVRMLKRLEGVRLGASESGTDRAVARLVMNDGKPFLTVYLKWQGDRWAIDGFK